MQETGKSVILRVSIKVVKTSDARGMLSADNIKDPNKEIKGLPGITWNNSNVYILELESISSLITKIINKAEVAVKGKPDILILQIKG